MIQRVGYKMQGCNHSNGGSKFQCQQKPIVIPEKCPTKETRGNTTCKKTNWTRGPKLMVNFPPQNR
eukprot:scaffold26443_cov152-Cylindrotheca_fusiformis.AAC.1